MPPKITATPNRNAISLRLIPRRSRVRLAFPVRRVRPWARDGDQREGDDRGADAPLGLPLTGHRPACRRMVEGGAGGEEEREDEPDHHGFVACTPRRARAARACR